MSVFKIAVKLYYMDPDEYGSMRIRMNTDPCGSGWIRIHADPDEYGSMRIRMNTDPCGSGWIQIHADPDPHPLRKSEWKPVRCVLTSRNSVLWCVLNAALGPLCLCYNSLSFLDHQVRSLSNSTTGNGLAQSFKGQCHRIVYIWVFWDTPFKKKILEFMVGLGATE